MREDPHRFDCVEALNEAMPGWTLDLRPLDHGGATLQSISTPGIRLDKVSFDVPVHQLGEPPESAYTIGLLCEGDYELRWNGSLVTGDALEVFAPGERFDSTGPAGFAAFTLSVEQSWLDGLAAQLGFRALTEVTRGEPRVCRIGRHVAADLRRSLSGQLRLGLPAEVRLAQDVLAELATDVLGAVQVADPCGVHPRRRRRMFQRAIDVIAACGVEALSVQRLCELSGCSVSTLERAFLEQVGLGPKAYLLSLRLQGARRELRQAHGDERISSIAGRWGFWHMGKFAADYRRRFGELPSHTLGRKPH